MTNSEGKSLPKKIAEDIIAFILEENLQPGDKLPNETVLCERLNVGRSSLREAMRALASRNIVTIRQGSGTYVASSTGVINDPLGLNFIKNKQKLIHDLMEIRFLLEPSIHTFYDLFHFILSVILFKRREEKGWESRFRQSFLFLLCR